MDWLHARDPVSAWTHFSWMILAIPGTFVLLRLSRRRPHQQLAMLVFGLSLIFCMAASFLYHDVPERLSEPFNALDHVGIYMLIAGTVTAIAVVGLRGPWRLGLLILIWLLAAMGIVLRMLTDPPLAVRTTFYLVMGWVGVVTYFQLVRRLSHREVSLIWIGGIFYSVGAIINVYHWPAPAPWFDAHDIFHLFVMSGSLCHYAFMVVALTRHRDLPVPAATISSFTVAPIGTARKPQSVF